MKIVEKYSVILRDVCSELESTDYIGSYSECIQRAELLCRESSIIGMYEVLVRQEVHSTLDLVISPS